MNLDQLRKQVDSVDAQIIKLLNTRAAFTKKIGVIKQKAKKGVYVPDREKDIYQKVTRLNEGPLPDHSVKAIYREIMSSSLGIEKPVKIAYFGPEFTFTHLAALKKFGSSVGYAGCNTITDVFVEVERGRADYGVVPIENSIEGAVNHTLDMFIESPLLICSEVYLDISHNVLSKERSLAAIKRLYSNPQVFGQCRIWLETNAPKAELVEISSTAKAAERASLEKHSGCIASAMAAERYGLSMLYKAIQDSSYNVTRFLIIGKTQAKPTGHDKTSVMLSIKDRVGALHDILMPFKRFRINLTKIESRPSKVRPWEYYFFIDLEGHISDAGVAKALATIRKQWAHIKLLGAYPISE